MYFDLLTLILRVFIFYPNAGDISVSVFLFVRRMFGNGYLRRGLAKSIEILQNGRSRSPPGHLPFW